MALSKLAKILISVGIITIVVGGGIPAIVIPIHNRNNSVTVTLLYNAGVMIEAKGLRIYVDPYELPSNYSDLPADAVLITHPHGDHYQVTSVEILQKDGTLNVFPEIMESQINYHDGIGVEPLDQFSVGSITVTAFYMYTLPVQTYPASHPKEDNYTSYLIDINGFTIFHAGDSKNIPEYQNIAGMVDLALLPLGPGCQTMADLEVTQALDVLEAKYFIPIHFGLLACENFANSYEQYIDTAETIYLPYFSSYTFKP